MTEERKNILRKALSALKKQSEVVTKSYPDILGRNGGELIDAHMEVKAVHAVAQEVVQCSYSLNIPIPQLTEDQVLAWFEPFEQW